MAEDMNDPDVEVGNLEFELKSVINALNEFIDRGHGRLISDTKLVMRCHEIEQIRGRLRVYGVAA